MLTKVIKSKQCTEIDIVILFVEVDLIFYWFIYITIFGVAWSDQWLKVHGLYQNEIEIIRLLSIDLLSMILI